MTIHIKMSGNYKLIMCLSALILMRTLTGCLHARVTVRKYEIFEITLDYSGKGNLFREVQFKGQFTHQSKIKTISGFYDGDGKFKLRFMPERSGTWYYRTSSNIEALNNIEGRFVCVDPEKNSHGMVRVANTYHFEYDDGTPYYPFGTTCYAWIHQEEEIQQEGEIMQLIDNDDEDDSGSEE